VPGDERTLKRLAGRIMSQQLDRGKPLWEMWVVEGLEQNRFAIISKVHHCMIDGVGPQFPAYIVGSRMLACYPLVPLFRDQALGVALFSYDGRLYWGFNADWDALPDLHDVVDAVDEEFLTLARAAGISDTIRRAAVA